MRREKVVFWLAAGGLFFVHAGYPLLLLLLRLFIRRPVGKQPIEPSVSLLVAAHNEADVIEAKIRNALALDYPAERLEIVVASDGSTDATAAIVARLADGDRIRLFADPTHRGKVAALNDAVPRLRGEIVAFSDATSMLEPGALRCLVESFADPAVGAVSGVYRVAGKPGSSLATAEDWYWRYETWLKTQEALLGSVVGAHGSLYAVRRALYPFPDPATINDDFVIPLRILQAGYRVAYEPRAVAYEPAQEMDGFSRRVRVMAGNVQQLAELRALIRPGRPLPLFFFLAHKVGRLAVPVGLVALGLSNSLLRGACPYRWALAAQLVFYGLAALGALSGRRPWLLRFPYHFCMLNAATVVALSRWGRGARGLTWKQA